jgi:Undecaprenyl-phosphate glucose phosphotransferase
LLIIWGVVFKAFNLYRPRRLSSRFAEILDIFKACTVSVVILVSLTFFLKKFEFSRLVFLYFWIFSIAALSLSRIVFRECLTFFRRKGYNLRHVVVVGDGILAREVVKRLENNPEVGINILGLLQNRPDKIGRKIHGKEILGTYEDMQKILNENEVDQIFIAVTFSEMSHMDKILQSIEDHPVTIKIVPDLYHFPLFCASVEEFDGLPILSIQDSPLYGWNMAIKRLSDILIGSFAIIVTLPLMSVVAIIIKLTSPGPVLFEQKRVGLNCKAFNILKFRTMHVDAEKEGGLVWTKENDPRRTRFGVLLRRTSLDELPQFFNVLRGDMSVIGPRPERPEFISQFKEQIPGYMLRHKMKAGITGWAQVNGLRGNTELRKRIEYDLYYIENWSLTLDVRIVWLTIWKGLINKNAY